MFTVLVKSGLLPDVEIFGEDPWTVLAEARRELLEKLTQRATQERIVTEDEDHGLALASRRETFQQQLNRFGLNKREFAQLLATFAQEGLRDERGGEGRAGLVRVPGVTVR